VHASAGEASAEKNRGLGQAARAVARLGLVPGTVPPVGDYVTDAAQGGAGGVSVEGGWGAHGGAGADRVRGMACSRASVGAQQMCGGSRAEYEACLR
jgi:hypothetical protein